jgi:acyl transferase domain-containing protein/acyl carrier protein/NAD(P)-dependent dehydrogenase (short-subunit alcohol dehydrogenase family)
MESTASRAIAIVGVGAVLPDAANVPAFWNNVKSGRYSISDVTPERWDPAFYYDPDPAAPDKTYSKIGGWVREFEWEPMKWRLAVPPKVVEAMDVSQKWAIACTRQALEDYGFPKRAIDLDRTAVILGNAMAGERHYMTALRVYFPEYARDLELSPHFAVLPEGVRKDILREMHDRIAHDLPPITEDSMPGELANCIAGRIANIYNFHGPNYVADAACASAMAAMTSAVKGLIERDFDVVVTGGIDRNMGASTFVKFCKIGALSATGSRPFADGADGFVMGEGAAIFLMRRLADAERDGDKIYAVLRGIGGSSDGKGKGITAPNPIGQKFAIERAWENAGLSPATVTLIEGHGTSTRVGDLVEVQSMIDSLGPKNLPNHSIALGSVKSNIGHLKGAAGAAGFLKTALALYEKVLPPSVHGEHTNPGIDFAHSPLYVNTELRPWDVPADTPRRAGLSAFGFGGTNFHAVLEEYLPGKLNGNGKHSVAVGELPTIMTAPSVAQARTSQGNSGRGSASLKSPLRGALVVGANSTEELIERVRTIHEAAKKGSAPDPAPPSQADLRKPERLAIDYADAKDLANKLGQALKGLTANQAPIWKALRAQGIFRGHGPAAKVAFLYTGQGSQYVNMMRPFRAIEPIVAETFAEADRIMTPLLGKPLSDYIFVDQADAVAVAKAEEDLRQTAITQPAVLAIDLAMTRLLHAYGIEPDFTMGHSLGEYGALVASGGMPFTDALEAVSARGRGMTEVAMTDNGKMAAVFAPLDEIERLLKTVNGYVVIANINSRSQAVIGGASKAVEQAMEMFVKAGYDVAALPVSHAFHTSIVAGASEPLRRALTRLHLQAPRIPIVANVDGAFYPTGPDAVPKMLDILAKQVAAPVQFVKGLRTLYDAGARVFVEVGPKKALQGFAEEVLGDRGDVLALFTNHPKFGDIPSFNQALCGLYASGLGTGSGEQEVQPEVSAAVSTTSPAGFLEIPAMATDKATSIPGSKQHEISVQVSTGEDARRSPSGDLYGELGRYFAEVLKQGWQMYRGEKPAAAAERVVITGAALGLPGTKHVFDDENLARILRGDQFIDSIPVPFRRAMVDKHITRLVKTDNGGPTFETITDVGDVIKLAGRAGGFDLQQEFGVSAERIAALDRVTQLAIAAGIDALRDAGIPLVLRYKTTTKGTYLPDRWVLPESLRDDTGVIFASAFPGCNSFADMMSRYYADRGRREQLTALEAVRARVAENDGRSVLCQELDRRIQEVRAVLEKDPYVFDRRMLFRVLSMGHSQFAECIGARGPNTAINAACASTTQAVSLAQDWIRAGRCRRVVVVTADDITSDHVIDWFGAGFLASGAAATDDNVEEAALPFDRRRHGMIVGMGAAAVVVESIDAVRERGLQPICEVLGAVTANSAFHGTRLDVDHIGQIMESLIRQAEERHGIDRHEIAARTVFMSHETYTPARGGSASAEIHALRRVFGDAADKIVIANTKGFTGHAMGAGIEDVVAIKALETGIVPPVPNFKEVDPELGPLNLSKGGTYPVEYALRLGAGFGSQISMTLVRWIRTKDGVRRSPASLGYQYRVVDQKNWNTWLASIAGRPAAQLDVVHHTLRVRDQGAPIRVAEAQDLRPAPVPAPPPQPKPIKTVAPKVVPTPVPVTVPRPVAAAAAVEMAKTESVTTSMPAMQADSVKQRVLALVSDKTGYPIDMLDLDLDLEADLGVDTVKQAEVFASIREAYGIARDDQIKLRDFPTLAHVIGFVHQRRPDLLVETSAVSVAEQPKAPSASGTKPEAVEAKEPAAMSAAAVQAPAASAVVSDEVKERVLALVVEKTGYPQEMLDLDLDLEADLGVDTVKQAEMFAAIREIYNIPRDENRKLRDYPTLAHVIRFVYERRPDLGPQVAAPPLTKEKPEVAAAIGEASAPVTTPTTDMVKERILALVVEKTGYPQDMLDLDLDLEADLGVDTVKQAEMFAAIREIYSIPRDENRKLRDYPTLAHVIRFVYENRPDLAGVPKTKAVAETPVLAPVSATPVESSPTAHAPSDEEIKETVLAIVAEKTGYPKDMLDLDLDLEADLGIDTVKQAEMFAAVRSAYNIPREENLKLRDFPTMGAVIKFARHRAGVKPAVAAQSTPTASAAPAPERVEAPRPPLASFDAANKIPRRVPVPVLRPPLNLCKATGVTLSLGRRVLIMADKHKDNVAHALRERLGALGVEVISINDSPDVETLTNRLSGWLAAGPIHGVYWLAGLDHEGDLRTTDLNGWREAVHVRLKLLYHTMRCLYDQVSAPGTFLISGTRLGGQHGYDQAGAVAPLGGSVTGFVKTYKRERIDACVKAVDFESNAKPAEIADLLIAETLHDPGAVEIGYKNGLRWTIAVEEQPAADGQPGLVLNQDTVFLITGAAGSIVSAITADLAAASGGIFYLLDLVPEPDPANPDLKRFVTDKDGLKRDLFARIQARGERATPALVEKELAGLERAQAAEAAIEAVRGAGGTPHYFSVDLTKADAVAKVVDQIRQRSARVDVLLHAAGMERSHLLRDKDPKEFNLIFDVKADGFFHLLHAIGEMPLEATVVFSSIAGRFGNAGQTDYSSANDLLCKISSSFRTTRPNTRAIAIDWTAWAGIGMASRGSIPKMMELAGIDMLPAEAGIPLIRRELTTGGTRGEVVIAERLGLLLHEWDDEGGLDTIAADKSIAVTAHGPIVGKIASAGINNGIVVETTLDPKAQPFLYDHQIDGTPVLPGVMGIEAFAEAAQCLAPGWTVDSVEDVSFLAPFKFYRNEPRTVRVRAMVRADGDRLVAACSLIGSRILPNQTEPHETTHFTARVRLTKAAKKEVSGIAVPRPTAAIIEASEVYRVYFHGPAYQVVKKAWREGDRMVGQFADSLPNNHVPAECPTSVAPRLIELCFQTAGLWEMGVQARMGLPLHVDKVTPFRTSDQIEGPVYAIVEPASDGTSFGARVVDAAGKCCLELHGYRTVAFKTDASAMQGIKAAISAGQLVTV